MLLDLSALSRTIQSLDVALGIVNDQVWFNAQRAEVQQTLLAGVVQNFEFVYELCMKMIRRRLELDATSPTEIDFSSFRDLIRTAAEKGLVTNVGAWFRYRQLRNITSHTYDSVKARMVCEQAGAILADARVVLSALEVRNERATF